MVWSRPTPCTNDDNGMLMTQKEKEAQPPRKFLFCHLTCTNLFFLSFPSFFLLSHERNGNDRRRKENDDVHVWGGGDGGGFLFV